MTTDYLTDYTRLPKLIATLGGFGTIPSKLHKVFHILYICYSICTILLAAFGVFRTFMLLRWSGTLDVLFASHILYMCWSLQALFSALFYMCNMRFGRFDSLEKLWRDGGTNEMVERSNFSKYAYYWFVPAFVYVFLYISINTSFAILPYMGVMQSPWPAHFFPVESINEYYFILHNIFVGGMWVLPQYWFYVVCVLTRYARLGMCIRVDKSISQQAPDGCTYPRILTFLTHQHRQLSLLVDRLNSVFGLYILVILGTGIPVIILQLYLAASRIDSVSGIIVMGVWLLGNLLQLSFVFSASMINTASGGVADALYNRYIEHYEGVVRDHGDEYDENKMKVPYLTETSILLGKLQHTEVRLTACGWFDITKAFFTTLIGVLVTYYLVILQFAPPMAAPGGSGANETWSNGTSG